MNLLKAKVFLKKHKRIIYFLIFILLLLFVILCCRNINEGFINNNPTMVGVLGTLLGAIIGGILSLMGSVWVNAKHQRAMQSVNRKNVIYSPLYDELVDIHNHIMEKNPYPSRVEFNEGRHVNDPKFSAWKRIKADTRYLEVPDILRKQMEELEKTIHEYLSIRGAVNEDLKDILNYVLVDNGLKPCTITNIGETISSDILSDRGIDIYHRAMEIGSEKSIDDNIRNRINEQIYQIAECNKNIIEVRKRYDNWIYVQKQTIEMLALLIRQVVLQYEG